MESTRALFLQEIQKEGSIQWEAKTNHVVLLEISSKRNFTILLFVKKSHKIPEYMISPIHSSINPFIHSSFSMFYGSEMEDPVFSSDMLAFYF